MPTATDSTPDLLIEIGFASLAIGYAGLRAGAAVVDELEIPTGRGIGVLA